MKHSKIKKIKVFVGIVALLFPVFLLAGCAGGGDDEPGPVASTVEVVDCAGITPAATVEAVGTSAFNPDSVTINAGEVVRWNNTTGNNHTVTSANVPNGTFNVPLDSGTSVCLKFTVAGTYNYHCTPHPNMTGTVIVP